MKLFAAEVESRKPSSLIVDRTEYDHSWDEGMMEWIGENIIPGYNRAGIKKLAFIAGSGYPGATVESGAQPAPEGPSTFPAGWFASRKNAYAWLASGSSTWSCPNRASPKAAGQHAQGDTLMSESTPSAPCKLRAEVAEVTMAYTEAGSGDPMVFGRRWMTGSATG